jgi:SAM-dependent methyltransferase
MSEIEDRIRTFWDRDAATYDRSPAHAISDPAEAAAWRAVLWRHLPQPPSRILEAGAGTGSITRLLADLGYRVTALDVSEPMLARARAKLGDGDVEFVVAPAERPPAGPFDAVVERNVMWTTPDPVGTLAAWRQIVHPEGRLLLLEGLYAGRPLPGLRDRVSEALRRVLGIPQDHHQHYDPEVLAALPLARAQSPAPLLDAVERAGWTGARLERLRDVEWVRRTTPPRLLGLLETPVLFALAADA